MRATTLALIPALLICAGFSGCDRDSKKGPAATPAASSKPVAAAPAGTNPEGSHAPAEQRLPAGHPATGQGLPPGHPPTSSGGTAGKLPAGHPPMGGASAPGPVRPQPETPIPKGHTVNVLGHTLTAPTAWVREAPSSRMRAAQFKLPKVQGDARDGVCTMIVAGGDVQSNINRWRGQFKENPEATTDTHEIGAVTITLVKIAGTLSEQLRPMAGGPATSRTNYIMRAMIAPIGSRTLFVKAWGPAATLQAYDKGFVEMAKGLAPSK